MLTLIDSASEAGDYPALVKALSMAVKVQRELGKDSASPRSFREHAGKYIAEVEKSAQTMDNLVAASDRGLAFLSAVGIGINFEEDKIPSGIKILGVRPDMPAGRAGVIPGDVLLAIDGVPVANMSVEQASIRLRGDVGSTVTITLSRSGHPMDIKLVRAPLTNLDAERREEPAEAITGIRALAAQTSQDYQADAVALKPLAKAMERQSTEKPDAKAAFFDLTGRIERLLTKLEKDRPEMVALARQGHDHRLGHNRCSLDGAELAKRNPGSSGWPK
jgi:C-terminal processing protease CtpA/Prc